MGARVAVVGAGPCGLFAALLLARQGNEVTVYDRLPGPNFHPRAMGISRRTAEIFRQCGLLAELESRALNMAGRYLAVWCRSLVGEEFGRVPLPEASSDSSPCHVLHVPQPHTEKVLREALAKEPSAALHYNARVECCVQGEKQVRLQLDHGPEEGFDWVLAADGARSGIRKSLGVETVGPGDMGHFLNVFFRAPLGGQLEHRRAVLYNVFGGEFFEFFVAVNGSDLWLMHHFLQPGERLEDLPQEVLVRKIRQAAGIENLPLEILGTTPWVMSPAVAKTWRKGRVLLVGDASARLSPAGGLGLNTGLQSVWNLAWKLGELIGGRAADSLLQTYEIERRPWAVRLMEVTNKNAEEIFVGVAAALAGDWARLRELAATSRRHQPDTSLDFVGAYDAGAFLPEAPQPGGESAGALAGSRAPHLPLADGHSLLDFFGKEFVLLAGRMGSAWKGACGLKVLLQGEDFFADDFESVYGIDASGAVLVRPDGIVGALFREKDQAADAEAALQKILNPALPGCGVVP